MGDTTVTRGDRVNILVVDDNADNRLTLESILSEPGQNVVTAASGRDALRCLLEQEFAVILLDVNMPGIDGFETASLVRQRKSSERTPIIFITAFSDEPHISRGYSLGAVDYIVSPVVPEVLRSKVAVFVDLFRKTEQVRRQAESLRRRGDQLYHLTEASLAINSADSLDDILEIVTETARDLLAARCALTTTNLEQAQRAVRPLAFAAEGATLADAVERQRFTAQAAAVTAALEEGPNRVVLVTPREVTGDPRWQFLNDRIGGDAGTNAAGDAGPAATGATGAIGDAGAPGGQPSPAGGAERRCWAAESGWLAAPLAGRDERRFGWVHLTGRGAGDSEFGDEDKTILTQLGQMASIAIENTLSLEAREANRLKDEFLTTLSHELRTPLTAILGWTRVLRTSTFDEVRCEHGLEVIERNVMTQARLIEDLLDVSRIIAGKLRVSLKPILLLPSIETAVEAMRPAAEAKGVALHLTISPDVDRGAALAGDADRLQQVGWNLVSNAIKFTPQGGRIEVTVFRRDGSYQIRVADTGKGISQEFLRHVFDRFRQDDSSSTRAHGGLGIGLAIVRHIVELHGGRVEAESPGVNRGATFTVTLPASPEAAAALVLGGAERMAAAGGEGAAATGGAGLDRLKVLLVDDEADTREILGEILRSAGAAVSYAASMAQALASFDSVRPDVLVSDIAMPGGDGYMLIRELRRRGPERGGWVPAVAVSAHARDEDRRRALAAGFERYVTKPVEPADFLATVREIAPFLSAAPAAPAPAMAGAAPVAPAARAGPANPAQPTGLTGPPLPASPPGVASPASPAPPGGPPGAASPASQLPLASPPGAASPASPIPSGSPPVAASPAPPASRAAQAVLFAEPSEGGGNGAETADRHAGAAGGLAPAGTGRLAAAPAPPPAAGVPAVAAASAAAASVAAASASAVPATAAGPAVPARSNGRRRAGAAARAAAHAAPAADAVHTAHTGNADAAGAAPGSGGSGAGAPRGDEASLPPAAAEAGGRRILLVEDDADSREALKMLLELSGHQVEVAVDGGAAVAHAIAHRPDVALVDIGLPEIDGNEVARRIRAELGDDGIFLVALTGYGGEADEEIARAAGFDAHFTKPVELARLDRLLRASHRAGG